MRSRMASGKIQRSSLTLKSTTQVHPGHIPDTSTQPEYIPNTSDEDIQGTVATDKGSYDDRHPDAILMASGKITRSIPSDPALWTDGSEFGSARSAAFAPAIHEVSLTHSLITLTLTLTLTLTFHHLNLHDNDGGAAMSAQLCAIMSIPQCVG